MLPKQLREELWHGFFLSALNGSAMESIKNNTIPRCDIVEAAVQIADRALETYEDSWERKGELK